MKFQSTLRNGLVFAGLNVALVLLPGLTNAQEITNTQFDDGPNVTTFAQPAVLEQNAAAQPTLPGPQAIRVSEAITASAEPQQASAIQAPARATERSILALLLVGGSIIALYAIGQFRRSKRSFNTARASYISAHSA
jgi:hypothetical protein